MTQGWLRDNEHRFAHAAGMAILGYGLTAFPGEKSQLARQHVLAGLPGLMRRSPFQTDGVTFVNDPGLIVGLALAVTAVADENPKARSWLSEVLLDTRLRPPTVLRRLFQEHARQILGAGTAHSLDLQATDDPADLAGLHWLVTSAKYARKATDFKDLEKEIFEDYIAYLTDDGPYRTMAVFIYDESNSVQDHGTTRNALLKLPNIARRHHRLPTEPRPRARTSPSTTRPEHTTIALIRELAKASLPTVQHGRDTTYRGWVGGKAAHRHGEGANKTHRATLLGLCSSDDQTSD